MQLLLDVYVTIGGVPVQNTFVEFQIHKERPTPHVPAEHAAMNPGHYTASIDVSYRPSSKQIQEATKKVTDTVNSTCNILEAMSLILYALPNLDKKKSMKKVAMAFEGICKLSSINTWMNGDIKFGNVAESFAEVPGNGYAFPLIRNPNPQIKHQEIKQEQRWSVLEPNTLLLRWTHDFPPLPIQLRYRFLVIQTSNGVWNNIFELDVKNAHPNTLVEFENITMFTGGKYSEVAARRIQGNDLIRFGIKEQKIGTNHRTVVKIDGVVKLDTLRQWHEVLPNKDQFVPIY